MASSSPRRQRDTAAALRAIDRRFTEFRQTLCELVRIPGISAAGFPLEPLRRSAEAAAEALRRSGLENVALLSAEGAPSYVCGDWLHAPGAPTVLVYGHYDVAPPGALERWTSPPFEPTERKGRIHGRATADDKGGFLVWVAAAAASLAASGRLPVNLRVLIEGEGEVGSGHLPAFLERHRSRLDADVLTLSDTANVGTGVPALTWQIRGIVQVDVEVSCLERPVHSGDFGGAVPDAVRILCRMLDGLQARDGSIDVPGLSRRVARPSAAVLRRLRPLPSSEKPSLSVVAIEAHPLEGAVNQILDSARARISMRTVPRMDTLEAGERLVRKLTARPPAGAHVSARIVRHSPWWTSAPEGPAFDAALRALEKGYGRRPAVIAAGGSTGFVRPFSEAFPGVACLLTGVFDPPSAVHSENESLHLRDWRKAMRSAVHLFQELGDLGPAGLRRGSGKPRGSGGRRTPR